MQKSYDRILSELAKLSVDLLLALDKIDAERKRGRILKHPYTVPSVSRHEKQISRLEGDIERRQKAGFGKADSIRVFHIYSSPPVPEVSHRVWVHEFLLQSRDDGHDF